MISRNLCRSMCLSVVAVILFGCVYSDTFGPVVDKYAVLYDQKQWQKDTGWSGEQLASLTIPMWNDMNSAGRIQVGKLPVGSTAKILSETGKALQVAHPETGAIGWIDRMYVRRVRVISNAPDDPFLSRQAPVKQQMQPSWSVQEAASQSKVGKNQEVTVVTG